MSPVSKLDARLLNAIISPFLLMLAEVETLSPSFPEKSTLTLSIDPLVMFFTKISTTQLVSPVTKFAASLENTTCVALALMSAE